MFYKTLKRIFFFLSILNILATAPLKAKDFPYMLRDAMKKSSNFFEPVNILEFNYNVIHHDQFFEIIYRPSFVFGQIPLGFGFVFPFAFSINQKTKDFKIRMKDYNNYYTILEKLDFFQYSYETEDIFFKISPLENITFGNGFIISNYRNTLAPGILRNIGLFFKINKIGILFETFISEFYNLSLIGSNISFNIGKIMKSDSIYLNNLKIGATIGIDYNTNKATIVETLDKQEEFQTVKTNIFVNDNEKPMSLAFSINLDTLLLDLEPIQLHFFTNYGNMPLSNGQAINFGILHIFKNDIAHLDYTIEFQYLFSSSFRPGYFNILYEIKRNSNLDLIQDNEQKGDFGFIIHLKHQFLKNTIQFNVMYKHLFPFSSENNELSIFFKVNNVIDKLHIGFGYTRTEIKNIENLIQIHNPKNFLYIQFLYGIGRFLKFGFEFSNGIFNHKYAEDSFKTLRNFLNFSIFIKVAI